MRHTGPIAQSVRRVSLCGKRPGGRRSILEPINSLGLIQRASLGFLWKNNNPFLYGIGLLLYKHIIVSVNLGLGYGEPRINSSFFLFTIYIYSWFCLLHHWFYTQSFSFKDNIREYNKTILNGVNEEKTWPWGSGHGSRSVRERARIVGGASSDQMELLWRDLK